MTTTTVPTVTPDQTIARRQAVPRKQLPYPGATPQPSTPTPSTLPPPAQSGGAGVMETLPAAAMQNQTVSAPVAGGAAPQNTATATLGDPNAPSPTGATAPQPAAPAGPTYGPGSFQGTDPVNDQAFWDRLNHGQPVTGKEGYSWYHTGSGWVQAPTGQDPHGAAGGAGGTKPKTLDEIYEDQLRKLLEGPTAEEAGAQAGDSASARAFRAAQQRQLERETQQLAEDNAYGGGDVTNVGLSNAKRGLRQQAGEAEQQFIGKLTEAKIQQRRDELFQAMQMAAEKGDNEKARALQLKIAEMDAATRNRATDVQRELGLADVDIRKLLGLGDLDVRRYGIDVGRDTALDQLGLDYADLQQRSNRDVLNALGF